MNVKQGDFVNVDGVESLVETSWAQGKHRVFKLADGRQVFDLDKLVASGKATVVSKPSRIVGLDPIWPGKDVTKLPGKP